ncbi:MAG: hypothetical protein WDA14_09570 [Sphaerochaetaceae bacterium]
MREIFKNGKKYKLPDSLSPFQEKLYIHLIDWKRTNVSAEHGYDNNHIPYDAILPENVRNELPQIYPPIREIVREMEFKHHNYFHHMASSQAANINLFLPILLNENVNDIMRMIKKDFKKLACSFYNKGFCLEYWGKSSSNKGILGDHTARSGTDADIAIAYYNTKDELCLWLIEHKLAENDFTKCGAFRSKARDPKKHDCTRTFVEIIANKNLCYYSDVRKNRYWEITDAFQWYFKNHHTFTSCPFKDGMNQLWRNQLMGFALEQDGEFKHVYFSVVKHPDNTSLDAIIKKYERLTDLNEKFSVLTTSQIVETASLVKSAKISDWAEWFKTLYDV